MRSAYLAALTVYAVATLPCAYADENELVEELVVVGSRLPTEAFKVGRAISVLDDTKIQDLGSPYAADLFRFVPGVALSRSGGYGGLAQLRLRGAEPNHVLVLIDGVEANDVTQGSEFNFAQFPIDQIERIEITRGPQSALWGSDALAGVIHITTRPVSVS